MNAENTPDLGAEPLSQGGESLDVFEQSALLALQYFVRLQEPLGCEFEQILFENLGDLYAN